MKNGYVFGPMLIIIGALISYYTGMLIVRCSEKTNRTRYEDIALAIYGKSVSRLTSFLNLICLIGFTFSYIVYVKKAIPSIIEIYVDKESTTAPSWIFNNDAGNRFWGLLFSFLILFPMSIPRSINALRFSSLFGVLCSMYLCIAVTVVFFTNRDIVPSTSDNLKKMEAFRISYKGALSTFPLIIFSYMYQVNIPMIYNELERRNSKQMGKVINAGSSMAVVFYVMVGIFGYATFLAPPDSFELCAKNILQADYKNNKAIQIGNFALLFSVMTAAPICVLPCKDTIEELFYKEQPHGMTKIQNLFVTLGLVVVNTVIALFIKNIGDAMTLVGSTINPVIGFILPILFYWPYMKEEKWYSKDKIFSFFTFIIIAVVSVLSLINFFQTVGTDDPNAC
jgi:amino acid permease